MKIHTLDLEFAGLQHAVAVFVVEGPTGLTLVETGPHSTFSHLESALHAHGWKTSDFKHVFLSHIHFDHAGAAWAFAEKGAKVYVHPKGLPHLANPEKLYNSARMIYLDQMDSLWGAMHPIDEKNLIAPEHGAVTEACGLRFTAWYTPGHAVHHIAWEVAPASGENPVIFTGDVAGVKIDNGIVAPPCPPPDINIEDWLASIQLLRVLPVETLYLTHFGKITEKHSHLDALEKQLSAWAEWMKPYALQQAAPESLIPAFKAYVEQGLRLAGIDEDGLKRYEAANPAFMSVAGLMRYWKKKIGN
jgi:glyoxylase-like metal-dependent hydrolase (beta-lactamase superfamily II)